MPLPHQVRAYFEPRFGHDFGQVKVHHDAYAAQFARRMHAKAFTYQNHIVFGQNQFLPATRQGRRLIAHELVHVVQQTGRGALSGSTRIMHSSPPDFVQRAAEDWLEASPNPADFSNEELALEIYSIGLWLQDNPEAPERQHLLTVLDAFETEATTRADQIGLTDVAEGQTTPLATGMMAGEIPAEPVIRPPIERPPIGRPPLSRPPVSPPVPGPPTAAPAPVVSRGASLFGVLGAAVLAFLVVFLYPRESIMSEDETRRLREEFRRRELERELRARPGPEAAPRPVPRLEPRPRRRDRREECLETHPYALTCEDEKSMEEVVQEFIMRQGYDHESLGNCELDDSHDPGEIDECNGAPGETWHCLVSPYYDPIAEHSYPGGEVSIFSCLCCRTDGTTGFEWRWPHWSPGPS